MITFKRDIVRRFTERNTTFKLKIILKLNGDDNKMNIKLNKLQTLSQDGQDARITVSGRPVLLKGGLSHMLLLGSEVLGEKLIKTALSVSGILHTNKEMIESFKARTEISEEGYQVKIAQDVFGQTAFIKSLFPHGTENRGLKIALATKPSISYAYKVEHLVISMEQGTLSIQFIETLTGINGSTQERLIKELYRGTPTGKNFTLDLATFKMDDLGSKYVETICGLLELMEEAKEASNHDYKIMVEKLAGQLEAELKTVQDSLLTFGKTLEIFI